MTTTSVSGRAEIVTWSKDSIFIRWRFNDENSESGAGGGAHQQTDWPPPWLSPSSFVRGYRVRYQAIGSSVIQLSHLLDPSTAEYEITHLHENTNYDICVVRVNGQSPTPEPLNHVISISNEAMYRPTVAAVVGEASSMVQASVCVKGTTATDSLSVALGSTFGAFLALGFIVALVFLAKWQHNRRQIKRISHDAAENGQSKYDEMEMIDCGETVRQSDSKFAHSLFTLLHIS